MWLLGSHSLANYLQAYANWRKIDGPDCTIDQANSFVTKVSSFTTGVYRFELTATAVTGAVAKDTITIEVQNLPARFLSWTNIPGQAGPFWDNITLQLTQEAADSLDYVMIRLVATTGTIQDWIPAMNFYEPVAIGGRSYSYEFHSPQTIFLWGSILFSERYDVRVYY